MSMHIGGKKEKEMYWAGRKVKEAWYEGQKVYSSGAPPWKPGEHYKRGDTVTDHVLHANSGTYRCLADHQAATDNRPYRGLLSGVYWELVGGVSLCFCQVPDRC